MISDVFEGMKIDHVLTCELRQLVGVGEGGSDMERESDMRIGDEKKWKQRMRGERAIRMKNKDPLNTDLKIGMCLDGKSTDIGAVKDISFGSRKFQMGGEDRQMKLQIGYASIIKGLDLILDRQRIRKRIGGCMNLLEGGGD